MNSTKGSQGFNNETGWVKVQKTEYYLEVDGKPDYHRLILEKTLDESNISHFHFPELFKAGKSIVLNNSWWHKGEFWIRIPEELSLAIKGVNWVTDTDLGSYKASLLATFLFPKRLDDETEMAILFLFSLFRIYTFSSIHLIVEQDETKVFPVFSNSGNVPFMTLHPEFNKNIDNFTRKFGICPVFFQFEKATFELRHQTRGNRYTFELLPSNRTAPKYRESNFILWLIKKFIGYRPSK